MPSQPSIAIVRLVALLALWLVAFSAPARGEEAKEEEPKHAGFELGAFVIKDYQPLQDITTRLIFTAHASVLEEHAVEFSKLHEPRRHRVRDQVLTAARLAAPAELQDPDLQLLRRRILLRLRHSLPELPIKDIFFSEFQLYTD